MPTATRTGARRTGTSTGTSRAPAPPTGTTTGRPDRRSGHSRSARCTAPEAPRRSGCCWSPPPGARRRLRPPWASSPRAPLSRCRSCRSSSARRSPEARCAHGSSRSHRRPRLSASPSASGTRPERSARSSETALVPSRHFLDAAPVHSHNPRLSEGGSVDVLSQGRCSTTIARSPVGTPLLPVPR